MNDLDPLPTFSETRVDMCDVKPQSEGEPRVMLSHTKSFPDGEIKTIYENCPLSVAMNIIGFHSTIRDGRADSYLVVPEIKTNL